MSDEQKLPFKALGQRLRAIRQKLQESVPEVCGAVEIGSDLLDRIERGVERPTEDILQLLINHFDLHDQAENLWQLAGYDLPPVHDDEPHNTSRPNQTMMIMAIDPRIVYSDQVQVTANRSGVVLSFAQSANAPQPITAARVGMSREQAMEVAHTIQEALNRSQPRRLPSSSVKEPNQDQKPSKTDK
jgi:transcriptional regulator with XRE-family HTH domain